jgi:hypothetical protein
MQDKNHHLEMLQAMAAGTDPITGEVFPTDIHTTGQKLLGHFSSQLTNSKPSLKKETRIWLGMKKKMYCLQNALTKE